MLTGEKLKPRFKTQKGRDVLLSPSISTIWNFNTHHFALDIDRIMAKLKEDSDYYVS